MPNVSIILLAGNKLHYLLIIEAHKLISFCVEVGKVFSDKAVIIPKSKSGVQTMTNSVEVRTKEELEAAVKNKVEQIIVKGNMAEKIHKAEAIKKVSRPTLIVIGAALAATPFTGGGSAAVAAFSLTATTGMSIAAITAVAFLGLALILSITNDYNRKFTAKAEGVGEATMEMNRK